jgi:molybdate transport system substrate-binding protein
MRRSLAILAALALTPTACGGGGGEPGEDRSRELVVFAAASLTEAFEEIGADFEAQHQDDGVDVVFNFGPSDGLATQIQEGAPADVFASASGRWMDAVAEDPGVIERTDFVRNRLVVLIPADNPAGIEGIEDLVREGVKLVLAAEGVPAGTYAREALSNAGVLDAALANLVSNEEDVKAVVQKVLLGEADAGIVYVTDVTDAVAAAVRAIDIPEEVNVVATYPIAVVGGSDQVDLAGRYVAHVLAEGQAALEASGFLPVG